MAKRRRSKCKDRYSSIDRISMLPDELLVSILSLLTLEEASATSILSSRWRYLWALTPKLDFDGTKLLSRLYSREGIPKLLDEKRWKYVRWVNQGIALHKDYPIEGFRVYFNLSKSYERDIDRWLVFALSRKVQRLELKFTRSCRAGYGNHDECYSFPYKLLCVEREKNSNHPWSTSQCNSIDFKYLREVSMHGVNVNGEALEFFLYNCPVLEDLSVSRSEVLSSLKIIGPFPAFKRLKIKYCNLMNYLEICDANLVYLKYQGSRIHFDLDNLPMLVEIFVGGVVTCNMENVLLMFSSYLPQLEIFTIDASIFFRSVSSWEGFEMFYSTVKMSNLKQLTVKMAMCHDESLLSLTNLIRASPCLERFVLEVHHMGEKVVKRKVEKIVGSYPHLKVVELLTYHGKTSELEFIVHFLENAVALEKILFDPRIPYIDVKCESVMAAATRVMDARTRAKRELTKILLPNRINLKIL